MSYLYRPHQIQEIMAKPKRLPLGSTLEVRFSGKEHKSAEFESRPELIEGGFLDMRYLGKAPRIDDPTTYDASFLLGNRVRGVGYSPIETKNFRFKERILKGWHQNICDPNLPTNDKRRNIHQPLADFAPTDFQDFIERTAELWKIELGSEWEGGLFS